MSHVRAPAKINLGLKIVGVRKDGYHLLESLFAPISLYDEISITPDSSSQNQDHVSYLINGYAAAIENDTVSKALKLFRRWVMPECPYFKVVVQKAIPLGAGLGGGSADAGAVLKYLYKAHAPAFAAAELSKVALKVGADVPFFLAPGPAWVSGIGERIKPIALETMYVLICKPPLSLSTVEVFGWYDEDRRQGHIQELAAGNLELTPPQTDATPWTGTEVLERQDQQQKTTWTVREVIEILENDLEKSVETRHPETQEMRLALRQWGALGSLMSGTGSSVYGLFRNNADAVAAREKLKPRYPSSYSFFICETVKAENLNGE